QLESWLTEALEMAEREGVTGAAVTPFLLSELHRRSKGRTLAANRALLIANARLAAEIAVAGAAKV
ncbi:MAG TPA: pseudouridine-5'-phosphate glycosidase, partial [Kiloniellales bacterium]|nr:pseudouridine-5'-phosphate glycosidase [Kiloniellales bacterium]